MSKGTYDVQKGEIPEGRPPRGDSSYRSFLCAILIFLILCLIIILVGNWNSISGKKERKHKNPNIEEYLEFDQREDSEIILKASTESHLHATKSNYEQLRENKTTGDTDKETTTRKPYTIIPRPIPPDQKVNKYTTANIVTLDNLYDGKEEEDDYETSEEVEKKKTADSTSKIELIIITKATERTTTVDEGVNGTKRTTAIGDVMNGNTTVEGTNGTKTTTTFGEGIKPTTPISEIINGNGRTTVIGEGVNGTKTTTTFGEGIKGTEKTTTEGEEVIGSQLEGVNGTERTNVDNSLNKTISKENEDVIGTNDEEHLNRTTAKENSRPFKEENIILNGTTPAPNNLVTTAENSERDTTYAEQLGESNKDGVILETTTYNVQNKDNSSTTVSKNIAVIANGDESDQEVTTQAEELYERNKDGSISETTENTEFATTEFVGIQKEAITEKKEAFADVKKEGTILETTTIADVDEEKSGKNDLEPTTFEDDVSNSESTTFAEEDLANGRSGKNNLETTTFSEESETTTIAEEYTNKGKNGSKHLQLTTATHEDFRRDEDNLETTTFNEESETTTIAEEYTSKGNDGSKPLQLTTATREDGDNLETTTFTREGNFSDELNIESTTSEDEGFSEENVLETTTLEQTVITEEVTIKKNDDALETTMIEEKSTTLEDSTTEMIDLIKSKSKVLDEQENVESTTKYILKGSTQTAEFRRNTEETTMEIDETTTATTMENEDAEKTATDMIIVSKIATNRMHKSKIVKSTTPTEDEFVTNRNHQSIIVRPTAPAKDEPNVSESPTVLNNTKEETHASRETVIESLAVIEETNSSQSSRKLINAEEETNSTNVPETSTEAFVSSTMLNQQLTPATMQNNFKKQENTCQAQGCKSVASNMLTLMDESEDACEDFYTFSCGNKKDHPDNSDARIWEVLFKQTMLINNSSLPHLITFRNFYESCVNFHYTYSYENRIDIVKAILKSYGMESFKAATVCDLDNIFEKLLSLNSMYFMEVGVDVKGVLQLGPSLESSGEIGPWSALAANQRRCLAEQRHKIYGHGNLNLGEIHESYTECLDDHKEFRQLLHDAIKAFGYDKSEEINQHYTINYINKLHGIRPNRTEISEARINQVYTKMTVGELQRDFPKVNWSNIFRIVQNFDVDSDQQVQVYFKDYFTTWFEIFNNIKEKKWLLINLLITDLYYNFVVHKVNDDVQNHCLKTSSTYLSDIASNMFLNNFPDAFIQKQESRVEGIFRVLKSKFHDVLVSSPIFSPMTIVIDRLRIHFSNRAEVVSEKELEVRYADFGKYQSYQEYLLRAKEFRMHNKIKVFGDLVNTFDRNSVTFYGGDKIYVPLGMVSDIPLNLPKHIMYARIGIKLAQSIAKHFDLVSVKLRYPNLLESYDDLIENTDSFLVDIQKKFHGFTATVNPIMTRNQRIMDNAALRLLTDTFLLLKNDTILPWVSSQYNRERVMMVAVAQEFCDDENALDYMVKLYESGQLPGAVRVHNMFMMSEEFVNVFGCADGSGMNENPMKTQFPHIEPTDEYHMEEEVYTN